MLINICLLRRETQATGISIGLREINISMARRSYTAYHHYATVSSLRKYIAIVEGMFE